MKKFIFLLLFSGCATAITPYNNKDRNEALFYSREHFSTVTEGVSEGNIEWLNIIPLIANDLNNNQSNALMDALIHSLVVSTADTVNVLDIMDSLVSKEGHSSLRDKFSTEVICAFLPSTQKYNKQSFFEYYSLTKTNLIKIGNKGKKCLTIMNEAVDEVNYEDSQGRLKWGSEVYPL